MEKELLLLPATVESIQTRRDHTIKIVLFSQELSPNQLFGLTKLNQKLCYVGIKEESFKKNEIELVENLKCDYDDKSKTPSKRMRGVFYLLFKQDNKGFDTFQQYYDSEMEKIIEHFKGKIEDD